VRLVRGERRREIKGSSLLVKAVDEMNCRMSSGREFLIVDASNSNNYCKKNFSA
jgi:hypothetical protein